MVGTVETGECFEPIEAIHFVKDLGVEFDGTMGREDTSTPTGRLLCKSRVWCTICTQEKLWGSTGRGLNKRRTMNFGL